MARSSGSTSWPVDCSRFRRSRVTESYTGRKWTRNLVKELENRWILLPEEPARERFYYDFYGDDPDRAFHRYMLHARVAALVEPAGPPPWSIAPATGIPHAITRHVAGRSGAQPVPRLHLCGGARRGQGAHGRRPVHPHAPGHAEGVAARRRLRAGDPRADQPLRRAPPFRRGDPDRSTRWPSSSLPGWPGCSPGPTPGRPTLWVRGWLHARSWFDGIGAPDPSDLEYGSAVETVRAVVAWALASLAHSGDHWYELNAFVSAIDALQGDVSFSIFPSLL